MNVRYCRLLCVLLSLLALASFSANGSPLPQDLFHGIKIVSSQFNSATSPQTVQLNFINDSPSNITAWAYCVDEEKFKETDASQGGCFFSDAVYSEVDKHLQEKLTKQPMPFSLSFVHPGEHKTLTATFGHPVAGAEIQLKMIAYSDGTVETSRDEQGNQYFQLLLRGRQELLERTQEVVSIGKRILADPADKHPAQSMISELASRSPAEHGMDNILHYFKRPEWRQANEKEFIPKDERGYLSKFVAEKEIYAAEFSNYQIRGVR